MLKEKIAVWKDKGVAYIYNGRTKQNMPMYIQFYTDCMENKERLNIEESVKSLHIPQLIVHGQMDPTVDIKEAEDLHKWNLNSELFILKNADHVFGGFHPYNLDVLPADLQKVIDKTMDYIS